MHIPLPAVERPAGVKRRLTPTDRELGAVAVAAVAVQAPQQLQLAHANQQGFTGLPPAYVLERFVSHASGAT